MLANLPVGAVFKEEIHIVFGFNVSLERGDVLVMKRFPDIYFAANGAGEEISCIGLILAFVDLFDQILFDNHLAG